MRVLAVILASLVLAGCFALDEIDAGQKEMDRYDRKNKASANASAPGKKGEEEVSPQQRMRQWWDSARTFSPRADDAKSDVVSCTLGGSVRFMRQRDCQNSGGRVAGG